MFLQDVTPLASLQVSVEVHNIEKPRISSDGRIIYLFNKYNTKCCGFAKQVFLFFNAFLVILIKFSQRQKKL
ncbi:MAG: hypothetical protein RSC73_02130, partial [Ruthenibacterium sp.]